MTSRFTQETYDENTAWRKRKRVACVYCSPVKITQKIPHNSVLFILELNITTNQIVGIGMCKNNANYGTPRVYENENYNRYTYQGQYHISREEFTEEQDTLLQIVDDVCFRGRQHLKRGSGITHFPSKILYKLNAAEPDATPYLTTEQHEILTKIRFIDLLKEIFKHQIARAAPRRAPIK